MKTAVKILLLITVTNISCHKWFCQDGGTIYKMTNYSIQFNYLYDGGSISMISDSNFVSKYSRLFIYGATYREYLQNINDCPTITRDSTINYITKFDIFSNRDYNEDFSCNDNLNNFFTVRFNDPETLNQVLLNGDIGIRPKLFFPKPPSQKDTFIFSIYVELNDGQSFNIQTMPVIITP